MFRVCFIDDDSVFEIPLFERVFGDSYDIVAADSYESARSRIARQAGWRPDLFVLDLYFPSGEPDQRAIAALRGATVSIGPDNAELRPAYGNFLRAQSRYQAVLEANQQGPDGGLLIAQQAFADYPHVPIVFYSRKATFEDAVRCLATPGVWWLEKKPSGDGDEATRQLTLAEKPRLVSRFNAVIAGNKQEATPTIKEDAGAVWQFVRSMLDQGGPTQRTIRESS